MNLQRSALPVRRRFADGGSKALMVLALLVAIFPLALVSYEVLAQGAAAMSWEFLTQDIPNSYRRVGPGMGPAVVGTLVITGAAALMAIPLGVLAAIYLNEYGKQARLARFIRTTADVMSGVPSIVMGLFILAVWVLVTGEKSGLAASFALAALMLPVIVRSCEEMLRLVPDELRQASAALGARRWATTVKVVLPAATSGITSGIMLAVARAAGETAPIVVVAGVTNQINWSLSGWNTTLAAQVFRNAAQPFEGAQARAWGAALTLMAIVLVFTILGRLTAGRLAIKKH